MKYLYSTGSTETSWLFNNNRQSSNFTALYSCFDLIDFISLSGSLNIFVWGEVSILWHAENTSSITKNIILCFLPGGICCQTDEFKRLRNLSATKIFSVSISPTTSPSKVSSSHYDLLKVNGNAKSLCESLYAQVRTLLDFACLWSCVLVYQHVPCLWHIDCRCYEDGSVWRRRNRRQYTNSESGKKNERYTKWATYQSETGGEIYLSSLNPLSFLMLVFNVSLPHYEFQMIHVPNTLLLTES